MVGSNKDMDKHYCNFYKPLEALMNRQIAHTNLTRKPASTFQKKGHGKPHFFKRWSIWQMQIFSFNLCLNTRAFVSIGVKHGVKGPFIRNIHGKFLGKLTSLNLYLWTVAL